MRFPFRPAYASLVLGDFNENATQVAELAKAADAVAVRGHGADHAIICGLEHLSTEVLGKHGSDTHTVVVNRFRVGRHVVSSLQWNVWVGHDPADVHEQLDALIATYRPTVVALSEAYHCGRQLAALADVHGYRLSHGENVGEGADVALLIRDDGRRIWLPGPARMREPWLGPKHHLPQQPRQYRRGRLRLARRLVLRVAAVHQPFGAKPVAESHAWIVRWIRKGAR